ncbi:MAG: Fe-S cluster assembly protein SufD [Myxococcales bacterium]|nr:Fe-S cluster assembly protein SufD [Deltaproteobacteria bacterium]MBT8483805.1 Fe-S cluster assembly protein SufD [Deltaproteobacteria bacterium]NNK41700.1 Fe-S cluster assembly protein SufD [Myxococcales bacterium]NNL26663.1 Fe-S cluster assembly protein SufD [Myxococcales bacterium]
MTEANRQTLIASVPDSFDTGPDWLRTLRARAAETLRQQGLPSKRTEAWRFTPVRSLVNSEFAQNDGEGPSLVSAVPAGVTVRGLTEVLQSQPELLRGRLDFGGAPTHFAALNTAMFRDGLWIDVPAGTIVEAPIEISHVGPSSSEPRVAYPRVLVTAGEGAELTLIETYAGGRAGQLSNSVVEAELGRNAKMSHVRVHESAGLQIGRVDVRQDADSAYRSTVVTLGGALLRFDVRCLLQGKGAECQLDGAYLTDGDDHVDHHTLVEHEAPECRSAQTYRGIVSGKSTAVFDGIVIVHRDAQKTEAHQENRNLLLSDTATIHTKPHLEIDADDVICSHGATVGALDQDQLFYLRARGVPEDFALAMLTYAFVESIVDRVSHEPTRSRMREALLSRIPYGDEIREVT